MDNNNFQKRLQAYQENTSSDLKKLPKPSPSLKINFETFNRDLIDPKNAIHNCSIHVVPSDTLDTAHRLKQQ